MKSRKMDNLIQLNNKKPTYNKMKGTYTLDFKGRAKIGSVKNFQLNKNSEPDKVVFQLCKETDKSYNCDFC